MAEGGDLMVASQGLRGPGLKGPRDHSRAPAGQIGHGPAGTYAPVLALISLGPRPRQGEAWVETDFPTEDKFDGLPTSRKKAIPGRGVRGLSSVFRRLATSFVILRVFPYTLRSEVVPVGRPEILVSGHGAGPKAAGVARSRFWWHRTSMSGTARAADGREWRPR